MEIIENYIQLVLMICAAVVALSAMTVVLLLIQIRRDVQQVLRPTELERIERLNEQMRANDLLINSQLGRNALVEFFASEIHISAFLKEAEEKIEMAKSVEEMRDALEQMKREEKKRWWSADSLKRGVKAVGEKLFDKVNDFIKPYFGSSKE